MCSQAMSANSEFKDAFNMELLSAIKKKKKTFYDILEYPLVHGRRSRGDGGGGGYIPPNISGGGMACTIIPPPPNNSPLKKNNKKKN